MVPPARQTKSAAALTTRRCSGEELVILLNARGAPPRRRWSSFSTARGAPPPLACAHRRDYVAGFAVSLVCGRTRPAAAPASPSPAAPTDLTALAGRRVFGAVRVAVALPVMMWLRMLVRLAVRVRMRRRMRAALRPRLPPSLDRLGSPPNTSIHVSASSNDGRGSCRARHAAADRMRSSAAASAD